MPVHCFTHIDPPLHAAIGGASIDEIPFSRLIGKASIIDLSDLPDNSKITADILSLSGEHVSGGIVLIKTCRNLKYSIHDAAFWTASPYMDESAGKWLISKKVSAVGFDFPQDFVLRDFFAGSVPSIQEMTMHNLLLRNNILQIEYLTNMNKLHNQTATLFAIPLRLAHAAGSPARVFAQEHVY